ncbi:hypothetical protein BC828DRAFT_394508 [Blastocladiella britannica]|nr:hypothetical protein BC828DRAFT_394508 [Blastocladiella britannica]
MHGKRGSTRLAGASTGGSSPIVVGNGMGSSMAVGSKSAALAAARRRRDDATDPPRPRPRPPPRVSVVRARFSGGSTGVFSVWLALAALLLSAATADVVEGEARFRDGALVLVLVLVSPVTLLAVGGGRASSKLLGSGCDSINKFGCLRHHSTERSDPVNGDVRPCPAVEVASVRLD